MGEKRLFFFPASTDKEESKNRFFIPGNKSTLKIYRYEAKTILKEVFKGKAYCAIAFAICNHTGFCADNGEYPEQAFA
jgi:hypothetical protein